VLRVLTLGVCPPYLCGAAPASVQFTSFVGSLRGSFVGIIVELTPQKVEFELSEVIADASEWSDSFMIRVMRSIKPRSFPSVNSAYKWFFFSHELYFRHLGASYEKFVNV
jgi:hypothetical protein